MIGNWAANDDIAVSSYVARLTNTHYCFLVFLM